MNEIDVQKSLVKEAFSKQVLPSYGLVDQSSTESVVGVRNYIWRITGYLANDKGLNGIHHSQRL